MQTETTETIDRLFLAAQAMLKQGRGRAALPMIAALEQVGAPARRVSHLRGTVALQEGRTEEALAAFDAAIGAGEPEPGLLCERAAARARLRNLNGALDDVAHAVEIAPADPTALMLFGDLLVKAERLDDAVLILGEAARVTQGQVEPVMALSNALDRAGHVEAAEESLSALEAAHPWSLPIRCTRIARLLRRRDWTGAEQHARATMGLGFRDARLLTMLGNALRMQGRKAEAATAFEQALRLAPENEYLRHLAAAHGSGAGADKAPESYVASVFDGYAQNFDLHLLRLGYRVPGLVRNALLASLPGLAEGTQHGPVLDLGCGTGLVAIAVSDLALGPIVGIDVSERMLDIARSRELYAELRQAELHAALSQDTATWPVIVAADVLCYIGELAPLMKLIASRLAPGGRLVFSVELAPSGTDSGWVLRDTARYGHTRAYVEQSLAAAGLSPVTIAEEPLREEEGSALTGLIVTATRRS